MLTYFLTGYKILCVSRESTADFLELCRLHGFVYDQFTPYADGHLTLRMKATTASKALDAAEACCVQVTEIKTGGLPSILARLFRRPGLWVGGLLAVALLIFSSRFVWDIRVSGNRILTEREVEATLKECGFGVGSYLGRFKADRTENRALMQNPALAWISVNVKGTVAYVEIRETASPSSNATNTPANLVADTGGQIVRVELERGNVIVRAGQWVDQGDLLVSGLYDSQQMGIRYTHAEGRVYARTVEEINVMIPLAYDKKTYVTDGKAISSQKSVIFFENHIKFSKKDFNSDGSCDIIKRVSAPFSNSDADFPISFVTEWYIPYTVTQEKRTYAEAEALAYLALAQRIGSLPGDAEVLSKTITTTLGEDAYILTCTLECIRDIAKEQTFEVLP
ncbi:MAG: sporulation protein YqfD [Clostridia bacterium]|nr:sporulation protein YqfD [Clostridia bacterium]